ncbi:MAG: agmatinase [Desulfohalobiaceae bacterium]|nr:agmatinase [Desulfohalobiaceae bacterium]
MDNSYLDLPQSEGKEILVWPVPYEGTASFATGTRNGPRAILQASREIETWDEELGVDLADSLRFRSLPSFRAPVSGPSGMLSGMRQDLDRHCDCSEEFLLTLGGEHSVALPPMEAYLGQHPDLVVIQLDAHADLRPEFQGSQFSHACVMARLRDSGVPLVQIGLRSLCREESEYIRSRSGTDMLPLFAHHLPPPAEAARRIRDFVGKSPVYISFDADALDPSIMPGTGTPEPGGLSYEWVQALWGHLLPGVRLVGLDFCELAPLPAGGVVSESVAVQCINKILACAFCLEPGGVSGPFDPGVRQGGARE